MRSQSWPKHLSKVGCFWKGHESKKEAGGNVVWPFALTSSRKQVSLPLTQAHCSSWKQALCSLCVGEWGKDTLSVLWKTLVTIPVDGYIWNIHPFLVNLAKLSVRQILYELIKLLALYEDQWWIIQRGLSWWSNARTKRQHSWFFFANSATDLLSDLE